MAEQMITVINDGSFSAGFIAGMVHAWESAGADLRRVKEILLSYENGPLNVGALREHADNMERMYGGGYSLPRIAADNIERMMREVGEVGMGGYD